MMTRPMAFVACVWLLAATAFAAHPVAEAALADRASLPLVDRPYMLYFTTFPAVGKDRLNLERALKLVIFQTSRQPIIEKCVPVKVQTDLFRIDLRGMYWRGDDIKEVFGNRYPYRTYNGLLPLVVRADWTIAELTDMQERDSYFRLLFGGNNIPKTRDDFLKLLQVANDQLLTYGMIEGQSGVSVQGTRVLEQRPKLGGYAWGTRDVLKLDAKRDPLEHPDLSGEHDGEEWIIGSPVVSITTGMRGVRQIYALSNGKGILVNRAPVDLVKDHTRFRNLDEIRNPGSCIQCHKEGLNDPTQNLFAETIKSGVDLFADYKEREKLELFHLSKLSRDINRANDDFATPIELACNCSSIEAARSFKAAIDAYDAPLNMEQTSEELYIGARDWARSLATEGILPARLASLPHGGKVSRDAWEDYFTEAWQKSRGLPVKNKEVPQ
jgi:hypothetical protein